ncbi:DHA2 family efflux MFS transporter permease subunit [Auraticoccus sp. F435]|uniref:DHA2 family efflux MFS transporter permease subunit n=1 Tax=Auraticoccus cholistanensis TaxID=2656650 RepID=A0A6A9V1P5_9ACTN|nr:MDR family MFS transporter [Auraticoccus cholistanensis]MVA77510.1 DHA2 family efflux MFS transporter permease subunit [Auraticoccus cholistanensis]
MTTPPATAAPATGLHPRVRTIFVGLMCGMLVASISQTIVSPAMPIIVAELGGIEHYSWLATAAMLVAAVTTPIVGKLSDLYGRRGFYIAGLVVFMVGSVLSGLAQNFGWLVAARALQGAGMGVLMPLSQTIIGDVIPPRQRGKYQGLMGAVFGFSSIAGPLAGGAITDHFGWRWLFFITIPVGVAALFFIVKFLHLDHVQRRAKVDVKGAVLLSVALVAILLATSWGGTSYPWGSWQVIGLYAVGALALAVFIPLELRTEEPILPLRMFRSRVFTFSAVASLAVAMAMFGAIFYIPVYAQGVLGVNATNSGLIVMPMSVAMIGTSMVIGLLITRTGRYKGLMLAGTVVVLVGFWLLTRVHYGSSNLQLTAAMVVIGLGLGACMQTYTLVVQNAVEARDMGVATAATQFFRSAGATVGVAVLGTVMTTQLAPAIGRHLPPGAGAAAGQVDAGSVLDPTVLAGLPPAVAEAIRMGLGEAMHVVFLTALPLAALAIVATVFIPALPLRDTLAPAVAVETETAEVPPVPAHAAAGETAPDGSGEPARHAVDEAVEVR